MKRKSILMLCALTTFGAFAQKNLVDDVEDAIGGFNVKADAYKAAAQNIIPALTNEETKMMLKHGLLQARQTMVSTIKAR